MKVKIILSLCLVIVMITTVIAVIGPTNASESERTCIEGMISYWKLDEGSGTTAYDSVDGNHGTLWNGPVWTTGKVKNALNFDGNNDQVDIPKSATIENIVGGLTLEAWAKLDTHTRTMGIVSKWLTYSFELETGGTMFYVWANTGMVWQRTPAKITTNEWHHFVGTWDCSKIRTYMDGKEIGSPKTLIGSRTASSTFSLKIGGVHIPYGARGFDGTIDEVALYSRALKPEEILQHYNNGLDGKGYCEAGMPADVRLTPQSLNLDSMGNWVTVKVEGFPENPEYTPMDVDGTSVEVVGVGVDLKYGTWNNNRFIGKADRLLVEDAIGAPGAEVEVDVSGKLNDGTGFLGTAIIKAL